MLDHLGLPVADVEASLAFYTGVFAPLGVREVVRFPQGDTFVIGLTSVDSEPDFWLSPNAGAETRELHLAFRAADRQAIDAVHEAAIAAGAEVLHAPREWPEYHPGYRNAGQCSGLQAGGEGPRWEGRQARAVP